MPLADTFDIDDVEKAYDRFAAGGKLGKVVLTVPRDAHRRPSCSRRPGAGRRGFRVAPPRPRRRRVPSVAIGTARPCRSRSIARAGWRARSPCGPPACPAAAQPSKGTIMFRPGARGSRRWTRCPTETWSPRLRARLRRGHLRPAGHGRSGRAELFRALDVPAARPRSSPVAGPNWAPGPASTGERLGGRHRGGAPGSVDSALDARQRAEEPPVLPGGMGHRSVKHSLTYSGGLSRSMSAPTPRHSVSASPRSARTPPAGDRGRWPSPSRSCSRGA